MSLDIVTLKNLNIDCKDHRAKIQYVVVFRNLVFNSGKATLKNASKKQLNKVATALKIIKPTRIKTGGHSDTLAEKNAGRK